MSLHHVNFDEIPEFKAPSPYSRTMKILFEKNNDSEQPFSAGLFKLNPGQKGPAHKHDEEIEIYIALQGQGTVTFDHQETYILSPKNMLYVPKKTIHETVNDGKEDLIFIGVFIPPITLSKMCHGWEKIS
jgi:mannose-6-phosphate isomerase-like protein (cupin superfamily)